jgi:type I restriction enzyme S subunit
MTYDGNCRLGDLFTSRREKGREGLPTLSVTLNNGVVNRDDLDRKQETTLSAEEHLLVKPGDIVYNMMRMWQGASGLVVREGLVSPAYVVLKPTPKVSPAFASYLFKTKRMIYLFWAYSYGLTQDRLRLYAADFAKIPAPVPSITQQKKIAEILTTWENATAITRSLIINSQMQHKALVRQLVNGEKRLKGFEQSWREIKLGQLGETFPGLTGKSKDHFGKGAKYIPYLNIYNNSRIDPLFFDRVTIAPDEKQNQCKYGDIFFTTSSETADEVGISSVLLDHVEDLYLNSFCFGFRLHNFDILIPEYARFLLRGPDVRRRLQEIAQGSTRFNLSKKELSKLNLRIPGPEEQREIAVVLEASERTISNSLRDLKVLSNQQQALMQQLLTGKRDARIDHPAKVAA